MARKGFKRKFPPLEILRKEDVEQIKIASLDILKETGVIIEHKGALKLLEKNDCIVDHKNMRVKFPEGLVNECLQRCPASFRVKSRDSKDDLIFGGNTVYFKSSPGMDFVDIKSWSHRTPTEKEYTEAVTVLDALEHHDWFSCYTPYFGYEGVPEVLKIPRGIANNIKYSTKIPGAALTNHNWDFVFEIANIAGTELMCPGLVASSPLAFSESVVESTFAAIEAGFPVGVDSGSLFGSTAPATLAGAMAEFNSELLAGIVLIQLQKPYFRTFVWGFPNPQNMRTGAPAFGNIANSLFNVANNQIWREYGVPLRNTASIYTNSKKIDFQNGIERAIPAMLSALSGAHSIHLYGGIYGELTHSPIQAILDDDLAAMVGHFIQGFDVNDSTIAMDLIHSVGPVPGQFLDSKHTFEWWKKEQHISNNMDVLTYPEWERSGKKDCMELAKEKMQQIIKEHEVSIKLSEEQNERIAEVFKKAEDFYSKRGELV